MRMQMKVSSPPKSVEGVRVRQTRRRFIRNFSVGTVFSTLLGRAWVGTLLADCQPTQPGDGILRVNISDFTPLQSENGSVRLAFNPFTNSGPTGAFYPVLINRGPGSQFYTMSTQCQHLACVVPTYNATAGASTCPCHGSQYGIDGSVLRGPTTRPLIAYPNSFDGSVLCVEIPKLGFSVTGTTLLGGTGPRFELTFATKLNVKYQVVFRQSLADPGTVMPFATTADGGATATTLTGTGSNQSVYVDRGTGAGFYSIAVVVTSA